MNKNEDHLRLLTIFHYVIGSMGVFFSCLPLIHIVMGVLFIFFPQVFGEHSDRPPAIMGYLFLGLGSLFFLVGQTISICTIVAGRFLSKRKKYIFCFVMACVQCAVFPFGTVLGILTIVVLSKEPVKQLFSHIQPASL